MTIHPLAIVSPGAELGRDVSVGPFCVIESDVRIGDGCTLDARVSVKSGTTLGPRNRVCEGTVLGGLGQHVRLPEQSGSLVIGAGNVFRENATVHRALKSDTATTIGDNNLFMVGAHVAHDCHVGSNIIVVNNTLLGGHVIVEDRAYIGGGAAVHQFCRIGQLAMIGGHSRVVQDVPPFVTIDGISGKVVGLNLVGLRRNGFTSDQVGQLKEAYRVIYRRGLKWSEVLDRLAAEFTEEPAASLYAFLSGGTRGFSQERRLPPRATLKLHNQSEEQEAPAEVQKRAKAG